VAARQILTLDLDFPPADLWESLMDNLDLDCAMAVYSTHKHTPDKPRLRLIMPLSRAVSPDEYEAIARKIAEKIGIAHCAGLAKEATLVQELLSSEFDTLLAGCKVGRIKLDDLLNDGSQTLACNPIGQVKMLEKWGSQLNIVVGLCLGHDMIFNSHSHVPTTTLIVKDRKFKHNPMQALAQKQEL